MPIYGSMRHDFSGRKIKKKKAKGETFKKYTPPPFTPMQSSPAPYRRDEGVVYKSADSAGSGVCAAPEKKQYTGTLVKGIGTMHKSNAVPIIDEQQMKDIATMRRN
jgi:hypothetical protein